MNRLEDARDDYTVAIFYYPSYASAYFNRAVIYHRLEKFSEACADVRKAEKLGVTDGGKLKSKVCR
jgi:tetratricopeptide (TPR) repeat protein